MKTVRVVGGGLAGCEAAYMLANAGLEVELIEMKPNKRSAAHSTDLLGELVCSNSLKAERIESAAGLLKEEMRRLGSLCIKAAYLSKVPAGGALAVDRTVFSEYITNTIKNCPNIKIKNEIYAIIDNSVPTIIATGPLTDPALAQSIEELCGGMLNFYDAAAPIVLADSIDRSCSFMASRYERGTDDYINCPMNKAEYEVFYRELVNAERAQLHDFEKREIYEGCMPIEVMASRGENTIRFGPMKPVGLTDPKTGHRPWANLQLRKENAAGTMYNMVGFQTNLKFSEQKRVFSLIPALKNAEFVRYGVMHRNTYINSPRVLNPDLSVKNNENIFFAGQITGVEGYMESAACGMVAALNMIAKLNNTEMIDFPPFTMIGALMHYLRDTTVSDFQPMGAAFGILPEFEGRQSIKDKKERYSAYSRCSLDWFDKNIKGVDQR